MASTPPVDLDIPALQALLEEAGHLIPQRSSIRDDKTKSTKNDFGEVVNPEDFAVQKFLHQRLKTMHPDHAFVGEEEIGGGCATVFEEPMDPKKFVWTIDPIDGSNNFRNGKPDYAIAIGLQRGREPIFGMAYMPASGRIIMGGTHWPTTIDNKPLPKLKSYDPDNIRVAFGLGKRKPEAERQHFVSQVQAVTDEFLRPGCASVSITKVLLGEDDAYLSLKEAPTGINGWLAILLNTELEINVQLATLNQNEPCCLSIATRDFAANHLQPGSELAKCLENS